MIKVGAALLLGFGCCLVAGCGGSSSVAPTSPSVAPTTTFAASGTTRIFINRSASMEPTLDCKKGPDNNPGCLGNGNDRLVVKVGGRLKQGAIAVFTRPREAEPSCGAGAVGHRIFVKRVIGTPGETVHEDDKGFIYINGKRLSEPYLSAAARLADSQNFGETWDVSKGQYLMMSDNRAGPCDPRTWGYVPQRNIIGPVTKIIRKR